MRRALLLFAIVLGLAALAASLSRPGAENPPESSARSERQQATTPSAAPQPADPPPGTTLRFDAAADETLRLEPDRAAFVEVEVERAGEVTIPSLGLSEPAEPLTPARFDVLIPSQGSHVLEFTPAGTSEPRSVGTLLVSSADR